MSENEQLLTAYARVFQQGYISDHEGQHVDAKMTAVLISFLRFMEKVSDSLNPNGLLRVQKQKDRAQKTLQNFYEIAAGRMSAGEGLCEIADFFESRDDQFMFQGLIFDDSFNMYPQAQSICAHILKKHKSGDFAGEVFICEESAKWYDLRFDNKSYHAGVLCDVTVDPITGIYKFVTDPLEDKFVRTRGNYLLPAPMARNAINMLRDLPETNNIRRELWFILYNMERGEEIPYDAVADISTFDDVLGVDHCFFDGDRMDPRSYSFFADLLTVQGRRGIVLDSSYYDEQFRELENSAAACRSDPAAVYQLR